ncbi:MAG: hypothetical protein ACK46Q_02795 [Hyphomonas sp.]
MSDDNTHKDNPNEPATLPTANSGNEGKKDGVISKMETVKSAWDNALEGEKKDSALKHYQSAEKAQMSGNDAEALRQLDAATRALT